MAGKFPGIVLALFGTLVTPAVHATPNPSLKAFERGIDEGEDAKDRPQPLRVAALRIDVVIHGRMADVTLEARVENTGDDLDEARFALALPADAVVTGYALDVGGKLIDAELLDQPKARNVYENEVRKGIDPGLAEVTEQNLFQTRIYPLTEDQPRTIRLRFSTPVDPAGGLILPLETEREVGELTQRVSAKGFRAPPEIRLGKRTIRLNRDALGWSGELLAKSAILDGAFAIAGGEPRAPMLVSRHRRGAFFQIADSADGLAGKPVPTISGGRLRIYWDRSLSRRDDLLSREADLLAAYADATRPEAIDIVGFASDQPTAFTVATAAELRTALAETTYRGATSFAGLDDLRLPAAERCLLFSDGAATLDQDSDFRPGCRLAIVVSEPTANVVRLGRIAQASRGQVLSLTAANGAETLARLLKPGIAVVAARDQNGNRLDFRSLPAADGGWFVVGEMPANGDVTLQIAGLRKGVTQKVYTTSAGDFADADGPAVLWAAQRAAELTDDPSKRDRMAAFSRSYKVASPTMAFLVLERPDQYINADMRPPEGFGADWVKEYREAKAEKDEERSDQKAERLSFVIKEWADRKVWWNTRFTPRTKPKRDRRAVGDTSLNMDVLSAPPPAPNMEPAAEAINAASADAGCSDCDVVVTARRVEGTVQDVPLSITAITRDAGGKAIELDVADVLSDQPYLKALTEAAPADILAVLAEQEKTFGTLPAFYFDTSEWFRLKGNTALARALLHSAIDLPIADDETRLIVAFRMQRDGEIDRAIGLLERLAATTSFRPQPKRSLALALIQRGRAREKGGLGDLQRAFELLTSVALEPTRDAFEGIEVVALMEANSLIPVIDAAGGEWSLDPRLVAKLDTDVRIVIEWTNDDADIDLWVIEPNGEKVFYGTATSSAGGHISNDMTDGYGPEEYAIRRAPNGEYRVRIDGYSGDRLNPNGNGRVMARLARDFARPGQKETLVDAEISFERDDDQDDGGGRLIARMKVEPR